MSVAGTERGTWSAIPGGACHPHPNTPTNSATTRTDPSSSTVSTIGKQLASSDAGDSVITVCAHPPPGAATFFDECSFTV